MRESTELHLFRLDVHVYVTSELAPTVTYLVRAESPAAAANLVIDQATKRWPDYRSAEVLHCWSYPHGELVLSGAGGLELVGEPVPVVVLGPREATDVG